MINLLLELIDLYAEYLTSICINHRAMFYMKWLWIFLWWISAALVLPHWSCADVIYHITFKCQLIHFAMPSPLPPDRKTREGTVADETKLISPRDDMAIISVQDF